MIIQTGLLTISPKIRREGHRLVATTSLAGLIASLSLLSRRVVVDPQRKRITITRKLFWFFESTRHVPFDKVRRIHYQYKDMTPWFLRAGQTHEPIDCYSVRLTLWDEDHDVHLFSFIGEGVKQNRTALPDWMVGMSSYDRDWVGNQSRQSRCFVALLEEYTGLQLVA